MSESHVSLTTVWSLAYADTQNRERPELIKFTHRLKWTAGAEDKEWSCYT